MIIFALLSHQLVVGALLEDSAFVYIHDAGGIFYRGEAVGDDKGSPSFQKLVQSLLQYDFRFGIDAGRRLVKDQYLRIG